MLGPGTEPPEYRKGSLTAQAIHRDVAGRGKSETEDREFLGWRVLRCGVHPQLGFGSECKGSVVVAASRHEAI